MTLAEEIHHLIKDDQGMVWIRDTNMKVIELVGEHLAYGWSADELQEQHPSLNLGQIHSTLAYFYDHQKEFEAQIKSSNVEYSRLRSLTGESSFQRRLRAVARNA